MPSGPGEHGAVPPIWRIGRLRAYVLPGALLMAAAVCFSVLVVAWYDQDLSHAGDDLTSNSGMGSVTLVKGRRYRVNERADSFGSVGDPVGCDFSTDGRSVDFRETVTGLHDMRPIWGIYKTIGTFTAPETGVFQVICGVQLPDFEPLPGAGPVHQGTNGFIDADRSREISSFGVAGVGSAAAGIAVLAVVSYRRRDREAVPDLRAAWRRIRVAIPAVVALALSVGALAGSRHVGHSVDPDLCDRSRYPASVGIYRLAAADVAMAAAGMVVPLVGIFLIRPGADREHGRRRLRLATAGIAALGVVALLMALSTRSDINPRVPDPPPDCGLLAPIPGGRTPMAGGEPMRTATTAQTAAPARSRSATSGRTTSMITSS
ncbi:hypothetical protein [Actinoallomurus acaciae]|uniref:DUF3592 domain-containing protein n=1 Tax=Actinoallomurus acaciae TaxID=502577 RepID=A0ABV5YI90_9ACTN